MRREFMLSVVLFFMLNLLVFADAPHQISYQGKITGVDSVGLSGNYDITFVIYDSETGPDTLWVEDHSSVSVYKGLFSVTLGETVPLDIPFDQQYWVEIWVDGTRLSPRQKFTSSPYAMYAEHAGNVDIPDTIRKGPTTFGAVLTLIDTNYAFGDDGIGLLVDSAGFTGVRVENSRKEGISIFNSSRYGLFINGTGDNGIFMNKPGGDGIDIQADSTTTHGIYIHKSPDVIGCAPDTGLVVRDACISAYFDGDVTIDGILSVASFGLDTIWSKNALTTDTVVAMAQFKTYGELIADSMQAVGDTIFVDDNTSIDGNLLVSDSVGIGVAVPQARLHIEGEPASWGEAVGYFQNNYVGTADGAAVYAVSVPADYYGYGVYGEGGYVGVEGDVYPTGSDDYYGVYGYVNGGDGYNYALEGDAYGDGENYGVYAYAMDNGSGLSSNYGIYAYAAGGATNWAGYFDGDVYIYNNLTVDNNIYISNNDSVGNNLYVANNTTIDGDLTLNGGLNDGTGFGTSGQYLRTDGSDVFWANLSGSLIQMDTLRSVNGANTDTIRAMAQFYVNGELIADSMQAVGDTVFVDDNLKVNDSLIVSGDAYVSGRVGIGTDSPSQELQVIGDAITGGGTAGNDGTDEFIEIQAQSENWYIGVRNLATPANSDFHIGLTQAEDGIFHIQPDGNIGIGTTTPGYLLDVNGTANFVNDVTINAGLNDGTGLGANGQYLMTDGTDAVWSYLSGSLINIDTLRSVNGADGDTIWTMAQFYINGELIVDSMQAVGDTIFVDDNTSINGNLLVSDSVGIGVSNPQYKLHVEDSTGDGDAVGYFVNHSVGPDDGIAVYGQATDEGYYGYGVYGEGGYIGVAGDVYPTGSDYYYGVYGYVDGGDGYNYALEGDAYGDGENYGVYAYASDNGGGTSINYGVYADAWGGSESYGIYATAGGGAINWAGYFDGDVDIENDLYLYGGLDDGTGLGTNGQYLMTDGADAVWSYLSGSLINVDTLRSVNGADGDTIWTMAQFYINGELIVDSMQAVGDTVFVDDNLKVNDSLVVSGNAYIRNNILVDNGGRYYGVDATQTDSFWIYDDGDTTRFNSDNPIKVGNASLVVETDGDVYISQDLDVAGKTKTQSIQITNGAANGRVLSSDASGNATWQSPSRTRSILITPGMIDLSICVAPPTKINKGGWNVPCLEFANNVIQQIRFIMPIPSDWDGSSSFTFKVLWSSPAVSGNVRFSSSWAPVALNENTSTPSFSAGDLLVSPSAVAEGLVETTVMTITPDAADKFISIRIRRDGSNSTDTIENVMHMFGVNITYND
ncbi:hypothetical protein J7L68_05210 [bacterium]|nr:hypothetical protein [bacterium]